jgi:hypothetical protein
MNKGDFSSDFPFFSLPDVSLRFVSFESWPRAQFVQAPVVKAPVVKTPGTLADANKIVPRRVWDHPETA